MVDLKLIMQEKNFVREQMAKRKTVDLGIINKLFKCGKNKSHLQQELEKFQEELNKISKTIGFLTQKKDDKELKKAMRESKKIKKSIIKTEKKHMKNNGQIENFLLSLPNIPHQDVPEGKDEKDNVIEKEEFFGLDKKVLKISHDAIATNLDLIDMVRAAKISGSRFTIYKQAGAQVLRALEMFCLIENKKRGYHEYSLPVIVNTSALYGTAQLPKFAADLFRISKKEQWLIPTAEVSLTNYYADEILNLSQPKKMMSYSLCFRSESGSGGKDTKGVMRMHQFHKVELVKITKKEDKEAQYQKMVQDVEYLLTKLKLPYRKIILCSSELSFSSEFTTDFEVWFPSQEKFREVSSISMFNDFQSRRMKMRYKENGKSIFAQTMNGSGLALDRIIAALIENNYDVEKKMVVWPECVKKYFL